MAKNDGSYLLVAPGDKNFPQTHFLFLSLNKGLNLEKNVTS